MKRNININEITDGKIYSADDMVRLGCEDCRGCSDCCHDMEALLLDPYDINALTKYLHKSFSELLEKELKLSVNDGMILPEMNMEGESNQCSFLDEEGRCKIHESRPGICRLFPLGRYYHDEGFSYILQVNECSKRKRTKIKIRKWLGIPELNEYEQYIISWHTIVRELSDRVSELTQEEKRTLQLYILKTFFGNPYGEDFYYDYFNRLNSTKELFGL